MFKHLFTLSGRRRRYRTWLRLPRDTSTLNETFSSGQVYLHYWNDKLFKEQNTRVLREFSTELFLFLTAVTNKWMTTHNFARLSQDHQDDLRNMVRDLGELLDETSRYIARLELERYLDAELEELAEPVLSSSPKSPDYSGWAKTPFSHSDELLKAGLDLPLPGKGGRL